MAVRKVILMTSEWMCLRLQNKPSPEGTQLLPSGQNWLDRVVESKLAVHKLSLSNSNTKSPQCSKVWDFFLFSKFLKRKPRHIGTYTFCDWVPLCFWIKCLNYFNLNAAQLHAAVRMHTVTARAARRSVRVLKHMTSS